MILEEPMCTMKVRNAVQWPSHDYGQLCDNPNINIYSRYRPGYWKVEGSLLTFNPPRGGAYADPRGARNGNSGEGYYIGDFQGYNTLATVPCIEGGSEVELNVNQTTTNVTTALLFHLGEVDWFNEEGKYNGRNNFKIDYTHIHVILIDGDSRQIVASIEKSSLRKVGRDYDGDFTIDLPIKSGSYTYSVRVELALGRSDRAEAYFPNLSKTFKIIKISKPRYVVQVLGSDYDAFYNSLNGIDSNDTRDKMYHIEFEGGSGEIMNPGGTMITIQGVKVRVFFSNGHIYDVSQMRWKITGEVECYDLQKEQLDRIFPYSKTISHSGNLKYNFDIYFTNNQYITKDGFVYRLNLKSFENTQVILE